jgi:hypothetical protein
MGVKGGCSPQNNRKKLSTLVNELPMDRNKILSEKFACVGSQSDKSQITDASNGLDFSDFHPVSRRTKYSLGRCLRKRVSQFLVLYAQFG